MTTPERVESAIADRRTIVNEAIDDFKHRRFTGRGVIVP